MKRLIALIALFAAACSEAPTGKVDTAGPKPVQPVDGGEWGSRAGLLANNSEFALAEANGKLYVLGGYPPQMGPNRTSRTVQVYDIATDHWQLGPQLPQPNNHGMAASVNGKIYLLGGQTSDVSELGHVNTVYELDPAAGTW